MVRLRCIYFEQSRHFTEVDPQKSRLPAVLDRLPLQYKLAASHSAPKSTTSHHIKLISFDCVDHISYHFPHLTIRSSAFHISNIIRQGGAYCFSTIATGNCHTMTVLNQFYTVGGYFLLRLYPAFSIKSLLQLPPFQ